MYALFENDVCVMYELSSQTQLEMVSTDLVAELRAEVARWWDGLHKQQMARHQAESGGHGNAMLSPILGAMLGDGPIRMITLGQELTVDMDEKSLGELQFKDNQVKLHSYLSLFYMYSIILIFLLIIKVWHSVLC